MGKRIEGYLLDTNIISAWFNESKKGHGNLLTNIDSKPGKSPLLISSITLGEIAYGHYTESPVGLTEIQKKYNRFVEERFPSQLYRKNVSRHTAGIYGQIKAMVFEKYSPRTSRTKVKRLHQLDFPDDIEEYGQNIQENDLWVAAQALEWNLVLVTADKMIAIQNCTKLCNFDKQLKIVNWLENQTTLE